ncbi:MAG: hypothetical protein OEU48_08080 [Gammaproteobacteria bacterium]|nr:hypothetical protein [Gammaproteobacteria bacterium]
MKVGVISVLLLAGLLLLACSRQPEPEQLPVSQLVAAADCDVLTGCRVSDVDAFIDVLFETKPRALQPFPVAIQTEGMQDVKAVTVSFSMRAMAMGLNRYALTHAAEGSWQGEVTLPICVSGRTDWIAEFDIQLPDRHVVFAVPFVLGK